MLKRFFAYFLDTMLVILCVQIISSNSFINKDYDKYMEINDSYLEQNNKYREAINDLNEIYKDNKLSDKEKTKFEKDYKDINLKLKKDEKREDAIIRINEKYMNFTKENNYLLTKYNIVSTIATIILFILYFGFIPYVFDGQTLGKKIFKLRVESNDGNELSLKQTMIRTLIFSGVVFSTIELILFYILNKDIYMNIDMVITVLSTIVELTCYITVLFRKDHRGLHDIIAQTKVTIIERVNKEIEE